MDWPYPNFSKKEMQCRCGCGMLPEATFMEKLQHLRNEYGRSMLITSGARCVRYNAVVSSTGNNGPHTTGLAADVLVHGSQAHTLLKLALKHYFTGIGLRQNGAYNSRFMHLDIIENSNNHPRPWIWTY